MIKEKNRKTTVVIVSFSAISILTISLIVGAPIIGLIIVGIALLVLIFGNLLE